MDDKRVLLKVLTFVLFFTIVYYQQKKKEIIDLF